MENFNLLDNEEVFLFVGSIFSLLFTSSFLFSFVKVFYGTLNYDEIPIISISFCYTNNLIWYFYSDYIFHDLMKLCYLISTIISLSFIILYIKFEYKQDKFDSILNILLLLGITLVLHKLLTEVFNVEDKAKISCSYSIFFLLLSFFEWIYKAFKLKTTNNLNIYTGISLLLMSVCYFFYGITYKELWIIYPHFFGIIIAFAYIIIFYLLNNKYNNFEEDKAEFCY